jgi:hypothetical protein
VFRVHARVAYSLVTQAYGLCFKTV